jgi:pantoate--beta-alanine ligase
VTVFGQKDAQQLALVRRMVADLDLPVDVVAGPTVREPDGLALSSRNRYLPAGDRPRALALSGALRAGAAAAPRGAAAVLAAAHDVLARAGVQPDYVVLVDPDDFTETSPGVTGAALLPSPPGSGRTRLIDNAVVRLGESTA